jgi:hypothetical protein
MQSAMPPRVQLLATAKRTSGRHEIARFKANGNRWRP